MIEAARQPDAHDNMLVVVLSPDELERLRLPVNGSGGAQTLLRRLQRGLEGSTLTLARRDLMTIVKVWRIGKGGFQGRLPMVALRPHLPSVAPLFQNLDAPPPADVATEAGGDTDVTEPSKRKTSEEMRERH